MMGVPCAEESMVIMLSRFDAVLERNRQTDRNAIDTAVGY